MPKSPASFRIGRVKAYLRGRVWYLCYHEHGRRRRPRIGANRRGARQYAAQINAQLEMGAPSALSFEPLAVPELRRRWLDHHEFVLRSSVATIRRYRTATDHLLAFLHNLPASSSTADFQVAQAALLVRHLREIRVAPNGHPNSAKRPLRDKGVQYILECCRSLFTFAQKHRHMPPYAENPFAALELGRLPLEDTKPIVPLSADQERQLLGATDPWFFSILATLMLTGLRSGELAHLWFPDDLDIAEGALHVRSRPHLGWQCKTRRDRVVPLVAPLHAFWQSRLLNRGPGLMFQRPRFSSAKMPVWGHSLTAMRAELDRQIAQAEIRGEPFVQRAARLRLAEALWRRAGMVEPDQVRHHFMRLTAQLGWPEQTAPKVLRHGFATALQAGRVDPQIRAELMGHALAGDRSSKGPLGMTGVYTHSRPEIVRAQLEAALRGHPAWSALAGTFGPMDTVPGS